MVRAVSYKLQGPIFSLKISGSRGPIFVAWWGNSGPWIETIENSHLNLSNLSATRVFATKKNGWHSIESWLVIWDSYFMAYETIPI